VGFPAAAAVAADADAGTRSHGRNGVRPEQVQARDAPYSQHIKEDERGRRDQEVDALGGFGGKAFESARRT
jgi:hypothetical protein